MNIGIITMIKSLLAGLLFVSVNALAITECPSQKIDRIYVGEDGQLWMIFEGDSSAYITKDDPDFENLYALVLAAHMANKPVSVRYSTSDSQCNLHNRNDVQGIWLG